MSEPYYTIEDLSGIIGDQVLINYPHQVIRHLSTDSRKISDPASTAFFAIHARRDAHQFIPSLYQTGVRCFVISDMNFQVNHFPEANFIFTGNSLDALQKIAIHHRQEFGYPVIGITGSNGKTIVKEWLFQLLVTDYKIIRSPKSYNSQIGVPLSIWQMNPNYDLAIFEAGVSTVKEMGCLERMIKPTIGILTNIASPHDEGFKNREEKLKEKLKLFKDTETLVINSKYVNDELRLKKIFTWSFDQAADLRVITVEDQDRSSVIKAIHKDQEVEICIPFNNQASLENAVICWATMLVLNMDQEVIRERMERLLAVKMRLELKSGIHQTSIIDDSYNSDFSSLEIALDFLIQQNQHPHKTLILSDIHQTGIPPGELYLHLAQLLTHKGIDEFIGIGEELIKYRDHFKLKSWFYNSTDEFLNHFDRQNFRNESILIKGARHFEFERISQALTQKVHDTVLEINLNALEYNLNHYKAKLKPAVRLMAMVKAFAYGSGGDEIANLLQHNRVDYLAVAYVDEGVSLRQAGVKTPILVLNPEVSSFETLVSYRLEPELYSFRILNAFTDFIAEEDFKEYAVHIKLDTGMHRLGFMDTEVEELSYFLSVHPVLKVQSVLSHLAASESEVHKDYTLHQIRLFEDLTKKLRTALGYDFIRHIANTSAITQYPQAQFDMVRLGIGLYGIESVLRERGALQNVVTLKTTISQIKKLKKGDTIGYGRKGLMGQDGKIATVKIGYADGYPRALGNGVGEMRINDQMVPTIGNICMDMCMLDVTGLGVNEDDDVIVFGGGNASIYQLADQLNTIPYEVLTNISQRVKRVYYYE